MFQSSSVPVNMPLMRRRRPLMKLSSSPVTTVDAQGTAYLCVPEDHSWFQGNISTDDESNYSLYGKRVHVSDEEKAAAAVAMAEKVRKLSLTESDEENNNGEEDPSNLTQKFMDPAPEDYYRVTMIDHLSGQKHVLPRIFAKRLDTAAASPGAMFRSQHGEVTFTVENVYKGQKAELEIQKILGSPTAKGTKCLFYSGEINILFDELIENGRSWSL